MGVGTLVVVLDNTSGDNKNRFVYGFLCYLIHVGLFKEVVFLHHLVGHSHTDVDGIIGNLAQHIKNMQIEDLSDFLQHCVDAVNCELIRSSIYIL